MLVLHLTEKENKILIPKKEFEIILNCLKKFENVTVVRDETSDLLEASSTSMKFWDNEIDNATWNGDRNYREDNLVIPAKRNG